MNNIKKIQEKLIEKNLDAVLVTDEKNQRYATGFPFTDGAVIVARSAAWLITDSRYIEAATNTAACCCNVQMFDREHSRLPLIQAALKEAGVEYKVGKFPFQAIGKAVAAGETDGFVKTLYGAKHGELLGAHIVGPEATELIATLGVGIQAELTDEDIHATIFAHPTLSEAIHESMLASEGIAIHM